ncbi:MAG: NADH:flavin oxidoreductase [Desulfarculaceae bacterium]|nr:NADH:flavin oxidoreductase [Desulfarculaceae bacterium]MCF8071560.1 NADH:flavin oxidoreductase [Desulfarculaceae bacterium]MCF8102375.1 NADH:flavin oxidoreductase [Desulfarculaceae bacterium]MCF8114839.1 NADH:flavin oxidoreductase [Desulfarculaceae bacterium]
MGGIFSPWKLGRLELDNRLMRSATWEGMAGPDGIPRPELGEVWLRLAQGGVGLIVAGYSHVLARGQGLPGQTGIFGEQHVAPLAGLVDMVHQAGGKIAAQLVHSGRHARAAVIGAKPLGPSAGHNEMLDEAVEEMSAAQLQEIIEAFGQAAARAKRAGFDAVQLHAAHGYLISQFLSPAFNQRKDLYGGSPANRARFALEVLQAVREAVGPDYPVFVKLNCQDGVPGGLELAEAVEVAVALDRAGIDAIETSGGIASSGTVHNNSPGRVVRGPEEEGYFLPYALAVKQRVRCPVISVGGWRSPERIAQALDQVDAIAVSRPLIRQPDLPQRWRSGDGAAATCISCGQCLAWGLKGGIRCGQEKKGRA